MTIDARQISLRYAALSPEARRRFLEKLAENGVDFSTLPIAPAPRGRDLPLSDAQRGLWLTWQRDPASPTYNIGGLVTVEGALDEAALSRALAALVERHEPLHAAFGLDDAGGPVQRVGAAAPELVARDLADEALSDAAAEALVVAPFDLESGPLLRIELHRMGARSRVAFALHHILADGESVGLLVRELSALYEAAARGAPADLPPLALQFADYVGWRRDWLEAGEKERQLAFWRAALGDDHAPLDLPFDRRRTAQRGAVEGGAHVLTLPPETTERLRAVARANGATPFMAALSVFKLALARWSGRDDVRIGAPVSSRSRAETHGVVGYFASVAVLGGALDQRETFADALKAVRDDLLAASENVDAPFDAVVEALRPPRIEGVHPLFQVKCTEQRAGGLDSFGGYPAEARGLDAGEAHFDLSLDVSDAPDGLRCSFAYARDLFDAATVEGFARDFAALAHAAVADPSRRLLDLPFGAPPAPRRAVETSPAEDVVDAWARFAAADPEATALVQNGRRVTRGALDAASDRLARRLVARGVGLDAIVALDADRSPEWVLGALAILKAGGAYAALDPAAPRDRRAALVADCGALLVVSAPGRDDDLGREHVLRETPATFPAPPRKGEGGSGHEAPHERCERLVASFDDEADEPGAVLPSRAHPAQAAYVVYTSGSTGEPKGVVVTRGGLAAYVRGALDLLALPEGARLGMVSTVAADLGNTMLYAALAGGGELHLAGADDVFDPDRFGAWVSNERIDALKITPSHLQALLQGRAPASALPRKVLVLGGEASGWEFLDRVRALAPESRVVNHYGPTETTVGATRQRVETADRRAATAPIGEAFGAAEAHVLDRYLNPAPQGVAGELFIGGGSLARGYAGRPGLSAERFVPDPFGGPGARLYRTGDRVRRLADGAIEFLGRTDDQVKIRGFRVEPGEVAAALKRIEGVSDAYVAAEQSDGATRLVAYAAGAAGLSPEAVAARLAETLPAHMVPARIVALDALPLTPNGKVDRRALPRPEESKAAGEPPRGAVEEALAAVWRELLGVETVGRDDGFMALGGDSILSLKMLGRIRKQGIGQGAKKLALADVLNAKTLAALAERLSPAPAPTAPARPDVVRLAEGGAGAPLFCLPGLIVNSTEFAPLAEALGGSRPVFGFVSHAYTEALWRGYDVAALAAEYAAYVAEACPSGRCALIGWSSGGDLAFETARRLQGRVTVEFLGLVDTFEPTPLATDRPLSAEERRRAETASDAWLARSPMADRWRALFSRMTGAEREAVLRGVLDRGDDLPADGPAAGSREATLWAQLDKRVRAVGHLHEPLPGQRVHVWQAEDSLSRPERLRDWSLLSPVASLARVAGATHLDVIRAPAFLTSAAEAILEASPGA